MKRHRTDGVSLSFGLIFLLIALWWALARVVTLHLPAVGWLIAGGLIIFGTAGLLGAIRGHRPPAVTEPTPTTIAESNPATIAEPTPTTFAEPTPATFAEPTPATEMAADETAGDVPPEMQATIVQELLDEPVARFEREHPEIRTDQPGKS